MAYHAEWPGAEVFHPEYEGKHFDEIEKLIAKEEKDALAKEGIHLDTNHMDGYKYFKTKMVGAGTAEIKQPWEIAVTPDSKFSKVKCTSAKWTHKSVEFKSGHGIAYLTINDAATNNALTDDTIQALSDCIAELKSRKDIRLVILKAEGKMFCSGNEPKTYQENVNRNENDNKNDVVALSKFFHAFNKLPMFTIALCQGSVMGSGMGLLCACDMVVAVKSAHFQCSDCKLGVVPAAALPFIVRKLGSAVAKRFLCLAENWNAETAYTSGLVQEVVDTPAELEGFVTKMSEQMSLCGPNSVASSKVLAANVGGQPVTIDLIGYTADELARVRKGPEAEAGMKAILSRQKPYWAEDPIQP
eukprot:gnl/MRDRNA2_/MRDRNA2_117804_c0_seq1.p1 gnl/MRDRNA2_/MRDRNA2_117804_c0~~gnl/MRDRNA2_/MRDRNA2_117804_c0_seq1.p1  ORF type:complete len:358 (+),score=97.09 gnl/MRDRNA2_/MRDRNA2_117804_c0_seq1:91-1164(+)